ncbi:hypothetical protein [Streptomyces sp. NPDC050759]|uniref:hypothetical protein n=1 Tax=Streptomyces sp. NPDC050759 TaxID=3365635 RepID=UPI00378A3453
MILDSGGPAKAVLRDRTVTGWLALARADDLRVITSAATLGEVVHPRINRPAWSGPCPGLSLGATAHAAHPPVTVLTSDPEDLSTLCGGRATVIKV